MVPLRKLIPLKKYTFNDSSPLTPGLRKHAPIPSLVIIVITLMYHTFSKNKKNDLAVRVELPHGTVPLSLHCRLTGYENTKKIRKIHSLVYF